MQNTRRPGLSKIQNPTHVKGPMYVCVVDYSSTFNSPSPAYLPLPPDTECMVALVLVRVITWKGEMVSSVRRVIGCLLRTRDRQIYWAEQYLKMPLLEVMYACLRTPVLHNVKRAWLLWDFKSLDHHPHRAQLHMSRRLEPHQKWVLRSRKGREFNKKESYSHFPSFSSFFFFIFYFLQFSCLNFIPFPKIYKSPLLHWVSTLKSQTR